MMRALIVWAMLASPLAAHPHSAVDQQAALFIGLDQVSLPLRIVPSHDDGTAILAHLDPDGDAQISESEARQFARSLLDQTRLVVDGSEMRLGLGRVAVPDARLVSSAQGVIEVSAQAPFAKLGDTTHQLGFMIDFDALSPRWFTQPFLLPSCRPPTRSNTH